MSDSRATLARMLGYGGPILGLSYLLFFVQFYFLKYATDVLLLAPGVVGALFAVAKLYDAVSDPVVGSWSDRTRSRLGRRRPFLLAALPLLVAGFVMLWRPPASLAADVLVAWVAAGLFVFYTAFTLYTLPHAALGAELSSDSHQRTRLFAARQMAFTLGMLVAFAAIQYAMTAADARAAAGGLALPTALAAVALLAVTPLLIAEPTAKGRSGGRSLAAGFRDVTSTRPARLLLAVWFVESTGVGAVGTMSPYIAEYVLRRPEVVGTLPAAYVIAGVVSIPVWVRVSGRFGKRNTWLAAMLLAAVAFGMMMALVGEGDIGLATVLLALAGTAMGCGGVLSNAILADVIDLDERRTGERKEGIYSGAMTLVLKIGTSVATLASGFVLEAFGFVPNAPQTAQSVFGMRLLFAGLPCIGFLLGALLFTRFALESGPPRPAVRAAAAPVE